MWNCWGDDTTSATFMNDDHRLIAVAASMLTG
jgi:hypothetical protein